MNTLRGKGSLEDVCFINEKTRRIIRQNGLIMKTKNEGNNWVIQLTTTGMYTICFYNEAIELGAGDNGVINKTITEGKNTKIYKNK